MRILRFAPAAAAIFASSIWAQDTTELLNRMKAMEDRIKALEAEVQSLKGQPPAAAIPAQPVPAQPVPAQPEAAAAAAGQIPPAGPGLGGAGAAASKVLNPDISVVGDFVGAVGN